MDINYELYKVFYYVASSLSFSEASKQLYISQSAVSQSIKALEKNWIRFFLSAARRKSNSLLRARSYCAMWNLP